MNEMIFTKYKKLGAYHWMLYKTNTLYRTHANRVKEWVKEKNVLDVGAGDGQITHLLGAQGIDDEPSAVELAKKKGVSVILGSAYNLPFSDNSFDSITMIDVLEHLEHPSIALKEAHRVAEYLYIVTPLKGDKLSDPFHYQEWSSEELKTLVTATGFCIESFDIVAEVNTMYAKFKRI